MVDTVKLLIDIDDLSKLDGSRFEPTLLSLAKSPNGTRSIQRLSKSYAKSGIYVPRLTMFKRYKVSRCNYQLAIEFSAPKLVFGNNFEELDDRSLPNVIDTLSNQLFELTDYRFAKDDLRNAKVIGWHVSKNILLDNYIATQSVLRTIAKLDAGKVYNPQKTDFRDGSALHFHCNSIDIVFYDKMSDLREALTSEKRAIEKDSLIQREILARIEKLETPEVLRFEIRLNGIRAIRRTFSQLDSHRFCDLFSSELSRHLLVSQWQKLMKNVDLLSLDVRHPHELLENYLTENTGARLQTAFSATLSILVANQIGLNGLRNIVEAKYGRHAWYRLRDFVNAPKAYRLSHFTLISQKLSEFKPINLRSQIENNSK